MSHGGQLEVEYFPLLANWCHLVHNIKPTVSKTRVFSLSEESKEAKKGSILLLLPSVAHERLQVLKFPNGYLLPVREIDCNKVPRVALRCTHISIPRWAIILLVASVPGDGDPTGMFNQFQLILQNSSNLLLLINSNRNLCKGEEPTESERTGCSGI